MTAFFAATTALVENDFKRIIAFSTSSQLGWYDICMRFSALLFKLGAAPNHMWIADVYEGSPTIVSLIFAAVSKLAVSIVSFLSFRYFFHVFWEDFFVHRINHPQITKNSLLKKVAKM